VPLAPRGMGFEEGVSPLPTGGGVWGEGCSPSPENFLTVDIKMVGFRAFWWYYFAHVYIQRPITKSNWLVGLGVQNLFHPQAGGHSPMSPPLPTQLLA